MKNVKIIVGSIPKNSLQKKIALSIKEKFSNIANYSLILINDLPFYNYEIENEDIPSVKKFHKEVCEADGIINDKETLNFLEGHLKNFNNWIDKIK